MKAETATGMIIEIVSDLVCPWCYIGQRRLERALKRGGGPPPRLLWRAFQLNPDMPPDGVPRQAYLAAKFGGTFHASRIYQAIGEAGAAEGIQFDFDRIARTPNSLNAHRLKRLARRAGLEVDMTDRLYRAYFEQARDVGLRGVLADVAAEAGLDRAEADRFLASDEDRAAVLAEDVGARRLGITGVPCVVIDGRYALSGAQEPEFFLPLFDLARQETAVAGAIDR
ncbi:MAG TPA: DsbA family oxidoreductase [Aliidongia sp.]|uniref:DsbA family oxidoreductase n=1 Tax=Aliidongia sp. TaxID=1914230 RepID=UPI002DDCA716|nr:DsbA family oxidoreductase [Aliidongia sp.]HEV2676922.1 DsbA family oxidoreductase [Aliidongia sp.]